MIATLRTRTRVILTRAGIWPPSWRLPKEFHRQLQELQKNTRGFRLLREPMIEGGQHPWDYRDFECEFAAEQLIKRPPRDILDIGSYRHFVVGLAASYPLTSLDVRERVPRVPGEKVLTGDAKKLPLADGSVDCVISLCAIEHFGLGRYGDAFDPDADLAAAREMQRVLRPGGRLILSTTITRGAPAIAFNAHRIYSKDHIRQLVDGMTLVAEAFFSVECGPCSFPEISTEFGIWGLYCGCFEKVKRGASDFRVD